VVLTNMGSQRASEVLVNNVYDRLLGLDQIDWLERYKALRAKTRQQAEETKKKKAEARQSGTHPSHPLADFAGAFEHPGDGVLTIALNEDKLQLTINDSFGPFPLEHYHYDCFQISQSIHSPLAGLLVRFQVDKQGAIGSVSGPFEPELSEELVFQRVSEKRN